MRISFHCSVFALLVFACGCSAQSDHTCTVNAGGGWAFVGGNDSNSLDSGWSLHAGGGFRVSGPEGPGHEWSLFVTGNFMFDHLAIKNSALIAARTMNPQDPELLNATGGRAKVYVGTLDLVLRRPVGRADAYVFGGFGGMRRSIGLTGPSGQGALIEPTSPVVFGSGGNSGAFDAGAGLNIRLGDHLGGITPYVEVRVVHGLAVNSATTLIPLSIGIRY
jgi:hypothetical protein